MKDIHHALQYTQHCASGHELIPDMGQRGGPPGLCKKKKLPERFARAGVADLVGGKRVAL